MNTVETIDKNKVKITFSVSPERFEEGLKHSYNINKGKLNLPGFRPGKAPRKVLEARFGKEVLYEDAFQFILPDAYNAALDENELDVVSKPETSVESASVEEGVVFIFEVYVKPDVEISDYLGVTYTKVDIEATEDEINARIDSDRDKNSRLITITDRPVQNGDNITLDFEGFLDGIPFENGKAEDFELVIGSGSFIDTFEDQLIGLNVGDAKEVFVKFPENYGNEDLRGKDAMFKVEIKEIKFKEIPEADDDFAQDVSEFDTFEEYKEDIRKKLLDVKVKNAEREKESRIIKALIAKSNIDVPEVMIDNRVEAMINDFVAQLRNQGMTPDMYMQYTGYTADMLKQSYRPGAEEYVRGRLVLEEIGKTEAIEVTEDDIDAEITVMAQIYGMEKDKIMTLINKDERNGIVLDIKVQKALKLVIENAVEI